MLDGGGSIEFDLELLCGLTVWLAKFTVVVWFVVHAHFFSQQYLISTPPPGAKKDDRADKKRKKKKRSDPLNNTTNDLFVKLDKKTRFIVTGNPEKDIRNIYHFMLQTSTLGLLALGMVVDIILYSVIQYILLSEKQSFSMISLDDIANKEEVKVIGKSSDEWLEMYAWGSNWVCFTLGLYRLRNFYDMLVRKKIVDDAMYEATLELRECRKRNQTGWFSGFVNSWFELSQSHRFFVQEWPAVTASGLFVPVALVVQPHLSIEQVCCIHIAMSLIILVLCIIASKSEIGSSITIPLMKFVVGSAAAYSLACVLICFTMVQASGSSAWFSACGLLESLVVVGEASVLMIGPRYVIRDKLSKLSWIDWISKWIERLSPMNSDINNDRIRNRKKEERVDLTAIKMDCLKWLLSNPSESKEKALLFTLTGLGCVNDLLFILDCRAFIQNMQSMVNDDDSLLHYLRSLTMSKHMKHEKSRVKSDTMDSCESNCEMDLITGRACRMWDYWVAQSRVEPFLYTLPSAEHSHPLDLLDLAYALTLQQLSFIFENSLRLSRRLCLVHSLILVEKSI